MSRSLILSEQFTDSVPAVANALREHREDRAALLASLTDFWRSDERIRAAYLWGSFGRAEADDLSDLDPWLIVAEDAAAEIKASLWHYAEKTATLISGKDAPQYAPAGGGYLSFLHAGRHGLLQVDCYWQPQSTALAEAGYAFLFDRQAEAYEHQHYPHFALAESAVGLQAKVDWGLRFAWFMFLIAAKYLAHDPATDMSLMLYPRPGLEEAAMRLGQAELFQPEDWVVPESPSEKVERLRHLIGRTEQLRGIANAHGCTFSPLYISCLRRYLELVEGILKDTMKH